LGPVGDRPDDLGLGLVHWIGLEDENEVPDDETGLDSHRVLPLQGGEKPILQLRVTAAGPNSIVSPPSV
jgi:hypothetical protein